MKVEVEPDRDHPRDVMWMTVSDSGSGIPQEHVEQIFDPFFTTKSPDQGTGLGLMITHQIVADHGGAIEVRNVPEAGAQFRIKLPVKGCASRASASS